MPATTQLDCNSINAQICTIDADCPEVCNFSCIPVLGEERRCLSSGGPPTS